MKHKLGSLVFALATGALVVWLSFQWIAGDGERREQRAVEESIVMQARRQLAELVGASSALQIVDPLNPNRVAGKVFIYPTADGWQVSGHYRHEPESRWYPWLMNLDADGNLLALSAEGSDGRLDYPR